MAYFGGLTLVSGGEAFLVERALTDAIATARTEAPGASVTTVAGADLTPAVVDQLAGTDLLSTAAIACVTSAERTIKTAEAALIGLARAVPDNVALIVGHTGDRAKTLLLSLTSAARARRDYPALKPPQLPRFVAAEAQRAGKTIDSATARQLIDAIGNDVRALAAATAQLAADTEADRISPALVASYFAGQASVTAYLVADNALAGRVGQAIVQLRWALSTGAGHAKITAALALGLRQVGLYLTAARSHRPTAEEVGVPAWKLTNVAGASRGWSERAVAGAIRAVAQADAQIKGQAQDADFALERLLLRLAALRRTAASPATAGS